MSTLPGLASKGEKSKPKFQSLDINHLYKSSLGENTEKQPHKSTLSHKHGMQSLGKVPSARRPPANLPSLKSEHSGTDTAVSLVPSNGSGWGKQDTTAASTVTTTSINNSNPVVTNTTAGPQTNAHPAAGALPPQATAVPPPSKLHPSAASSVGTGDKSWSSVMSGTDPAGHPPPYQSPQFRHEFPSLSAGDGGPATRSGTDIQYGPGPSLRPQTEGSWIQGGGGGPEGARMMPPPAVPPQIPVPAGQSPSLYRGFLPPFLMKANGVPGNMAVQSVPQGTMTAPAGNGRNRPPGDPKLARAAELLEELSHRPIIKEEELSGMDNLTNDMSWALHDDIDYNKKLTFSDDESKPEKETRRTTRTHKESEKSETHPQEGEHKSWGGRNNVPSQSSRYRNDDDDVAVQRRRHTQEVATVIERAKQRKEEEEKKFMESKEAAKKKLQELDEKLKNKKDKEHNDESIGTINPASVPPQAIAAGPISILPEWNRPKPKPSQTQNEDKTPHRDNTQYDFRQMTQLDGHYTAPKKDSRSGNKDQAPNFSRQFQNDMPPRFQKLTASSGPQSDQFSSYENSSRWQQSNVNNKPSAPIRKPRPEIEEKEREDEKYRRHNAEDNYRPSHRNYADSGRKSSDSRYDDYRQDYEEEKRIKPRHDSKPDSFDSISRQNSDEWHGDRRIDRYDRPQRPDSRDSRASRESRHSTDSVKYSEQRDRDRDRDREYGGSWSHYEEVGEDKKREHRMQVPGPITKEKIEADDLRSEKRNLTQLKRGAIPEKKVDNKLAEKEADDTWGRKSKDGVDGQKVWADALPANNVPQENLKYSDAEKKPETLEQIDEEEKKDKDQKKLPHGPSRDRTNSQSGRSQGNWGGGNNSATVFNSRNTWSKKGGMSGRGGRGISQRSTSSKLDWHGTESEGSTDDNNMTVIDNGVLKSPKPPKKIEKEERNKEVRNEKPLTEKLPEKKIEKGGGHRDFIPRGEPSRHGRGGGSSFRGGRGGGIKRMDCYGPPPEKIPFSTHHSDKEKKLEADVVDNQEDKSKHAKDNAQDKKLDDRGKRKDNRRNKPKQEGDLSDNSDDKGSNKSRQPSQLVNQQRRGNLSAPPRDKRAPPTFMSRTDPPNRQNSSSSLRSTQNKDKDVVKEKDVAPVTTPVVVDVKPKKDEVPAPKSAENESEPVVAQDSDGFQEVKSKKTGKTERPKEEKPPVSKVPPPPKPEKEQKQVERNDRKGKMLPQQIANIPSLMATPINPPMNLPQPQQKGPFERPRPNNKIPPRFAKQRETNRLQKLQMQQTMCDVNDINKMNQNIYAMKDGGVVTGTIANAWEKPLTSQLRGSLDQDSVIAAGMETCKIMDQASVPNNTTEDKTVLDGSQPLNTIIFENTNFKTAPGPRSRVEKPRPNKIEDNLDPNVLSTYNNKPLAELLNKPDKPDIQMMNFNKEDTADIKLDFFENEISHLTEDKATKNLSGLPRTMHAITSSNNTILPSTADALNIKIQSVKKVWESTPTIIEHPSVGQDDSATFSASFDSNSLDASSAFSKANEVADDNHEVYSPSPNNQNASNSTTNVCKVKPTQQVAGSAGQSVLSTGTHQQHSALVGPGIMGHPLTPPPMQPVIGGGVGLGQPPQQYTTNQHINYQASLSGNTQYGMPAIPSPPTVLYNNAAQQQLQAQTAAGLYGAFQIDQAQVLNGQGRSQYSQYSYGLGQTASSPYSAQSMYLPAAQPHPPPQAAQAPPDLYTGISNYRLPASGPFAQNQQLNNPTTVLISSTSNSHMSPSVKPSNQQISAIGTKAGGVGQAYQQQSQQGQQLYIPYDPTMQANYLQNTMGRGPTGPVQNNVVTGLQPTALQASSSYYSGSTGGQTASYFQQGTSNLQSAQIPQHQASYGLQGSVFGTHNQSHNSGAMQNYGSPFLSAGHIQMMAQYRSTAGMQNSAYMKSIAAGQQMNDQGGRSQQLKSPGSQQEVLSSVFNTGSQISSPKSRQPCKQPPSASPTAQQKYVYQGVTNQQSGQARYPTPIQRPTQGSYQLGVPNNNQKHRGNNTNSRPPPRQYCQGANINTQADKPDESKLNENVAPNSASNVPASNAALKTTVAAAAAAAGSQPSEKADIAKEEGSAINKD